MKQIYNLRATIVVALLLCVTFRAFAQPVDAVLNNPINLGTLIPGVPVSDTKNNSTPNGYQNTMSQLSDDIYYKFTLSSSSEVSISHCSSNFDTYMHLLSSSGNDITQVFCGQKKILLCGIIFSHLP